MSQTPTSPGTPPNRGWPSPQPSHPGATQPSYGIPDGYPGQGYGTPEYEQSGYGQPVAQGQPMAYLDLTIQGTQGLTAWIPPRVWINGVFTKVSFGRQMVLVPAGPVQIDVNAQWLTTYGRAQMRLGLAPGQTVPVFYAMPWVTFGAGAIGHIAQKRPGVGFLIGVLAIPLALIGLSMLAALTG